MVDKRYNIDSEISAISSEIVSWYNKKNCEILNILSVPLTTSLIFKDLLVQMIRDKKSIVYLWGENNKNKLLLDEIKKSKEVYPNNYISGSLRKERIDFFNYNEYINVNKEYDLIIIDDISSFSKITPSGVKKAFKYLKNFSKKIIIYSVEEIYNKGEKIEFIISNIKNPYVEPRVINTRIDLTKDIPYILYEYIVWFIENKKKIIIYVPDEEKVNLTYEYYTNKLKMKKINIVPLLKNNNKRLLRDVLVKNDRATIIITNNLEVNLTGSNIGNAVILFADDDKYTYKNLLFICAEIGSINKELPEVLLVSKDSSDNMDKVRDMTRHYNKIKWEHYREH